MNLLLKLKYTDEHFEVKYYNFGGTVAPLITIVFESLTQKKIKKKNPKLCQNLQLEKIKQKHCTCNECLWTGFLVLSQYYYYNTRKAILIIILQEWYRSSQKHNPCQIYLPAELSLKSMGIWRLSNGGKASTKHKCSDSASRSLLQQNSYVNQWKFLSQGEKSENSLILFTVETEIFKMLNQQ